MHPLLATLLVPLTLQVQNAASRSVGDAASLRAAFEASRHTIATNTEGHRARNPGQRWSMSFDGRGVTVEPDGADWVWGLELVSWGSGRTETVVEQPRRVYAEGPRVTYDWGGGLEEWFVNDRRGLEHGYTVAQRPESGGPLAFSIAARGDLRPRVTHGGRNVGFFTAEGTTALTYDGLEVRDSEGRELAAYFTATENGLRLCVEDRGASYPITIDPVAQQAYLKASNTGEWDHFGYSFAFSDSGDRVAIGAPGREVDTGAVYVFAYDGTTWQEEAYLQYWSLTEEDYCGWSISMSGDTLVAGAPLWGGAHVGAAIVYVYDGTSWIEQDRLTGSGAWHRFGIGVSVSGDTLVVGASDAGAGQEGRVYVFERVGGTWTKTATLQASNMNRDDRFGGMVSIRGDTIVATALEESSGATGIDGDQTDNTMPGAGAVYVFERDATGWTQRAYIKASNTDAHDNFGASVAQPDEDTFLIGAPYEDCISQGVNGSQDDNSAKDSGAAYLFRRGGSSWVQEAYLKASNTDALDWFGYSAGLYGDLAVVGAPFEDSAASGIDGDQQDDSLADAGAAYLFERRGATWAQRAYLKASNPDAEDMFGIGVGLTGDRLIVGAWAEDSGAMGVDGDQSDNSVINSGAAYVFDLETPCGVTYCGAAQNPANSALIAIDTCDSASTSIEVMLSNGPPGELTYLLVGDGNATVSQPPGSEGDLCVAGGSCLARYSDDVGPIAADGTFATDIVNATSDPCEGAVDIVPGATWNFQYWHRQPMGAPATFSSAITVTFH